MITVTIYKSNDLISGFEIKGHSGYDEAGKDIVCASVSSVAYFVVNTVTDFKKIKYDELTVDDGYMKFIVSLNSSKECKDLFDSFESHILQLSEQYSDFIKVIGG